MKHYDHIWEGRPYRTPLSQKLANMFPDWSDTRLDPFSNLHALLGDISLLGAEGNLNIVRLLFDSRTVSSDLFFKGSVYTSIISPTFLFQYDDLETSVYYRTPIIKGYIGITEYILQEVKERDSDRLFLYPPHFATRSLHELAPLSNPIFATGIPSVLEGTEIIIPFDNFITLTVNNPSTIIEEDAPQAVKVILTNHRYPAYFYEFAFTSNGTYQSQTPLISGTYIITTEGLDDNTILELDIYNFAEVQHEKNYKWYRENNASAMFYRLDPFDPSYLQCLSYAGTLLDRLGNTEDYWVESTAVLLDDLGNSYEGKSIAKSPLAPYLFVLSNDHPDIIFVYDSYLEQSTESIYDGHKDSIELYYENAAYAIGETLLLKTRRNISFMAGALHSMRLKVKSPTGDYYIDKDGVTTTETLAWRRPEDVGLGWADMRWKFTVPDIGTYKFVVELKKKANSDMTKGTERIFMLAKKEPLAVLSIPDVPPDLIDRIGFSADGNLYGLDSSGSLFLINFSYDVFFLDYEEYLIYTPTQFDYITVEY